jgi:ATP synthase F1 complex assembly factor 2
LRAVAGGTGGGTAKLKRFWKDVHVKKVEGKLAYTYVSMNLFT